MIEIDGLIQKSYEDMSKGLLSEERFSTLTVSLESEQKRLKEAIPEMEASVETATDKANDLQHFIERARQVTRLTELTPEIVHEFIEKIMVSQADKVDGKRHLQVDIYYKTIGLWCAPSQKKWKNCSRNILRHKRKDGVATATTSKIKDQFLYRLDEGRHFLTECQPCGRLLLGTKIETEGYPLH